MQRANCMVRLAGSLSNTVPKLGVTPAEILCLQAIHGQDAVVDIRPTEFDKGIRQEREYERLSNTYDRAGGFGGEGEASRSVVATLFPGALKKLPMTLAEAGIDVGDGAPEIVPVPDLPTVEGDEAEEAAEATEADAGEQADTEQAQVDTDQTTEAE